jgi:hypothetical protein
LRRLVAALLLLAAGCATVRPWERGRLASPAMQFDEDPFATQQEDTVLEIVEGATYGGAGPGGAGGGCGCH